MKHFDMLAPCGIDCATCAIYQAAQDPATAERLAADWRAGGRNATADWFRCQGCRGDRAVRWNEECNLANCCGARGLTTCAECADFPCQPYLKWAEPYPHHRQAYERLQALRNAR